VIRYLAIVLSMEVGLKSWLKGGQKANGLTDGLETALKLPPLIEISYICSANLPGRLGCLQQDVYTDIMAGLCLPLSFAVIHWPSCLHLPGCYWNCLHKSVLQYCSSRNILLQSRHRHFSSHCCISGYDYR
jgi:hypothetical protein